MLKLFNTLTRTLEAFTPLQPGTVGMYTCGPTVYAYAHIGNMRAYVFSDTLRRALLWHGYDVTQVVNITDVGHLVSDADEGEDKLEVAAAREERSIWEIAAHYTDAFFTDIDRLGVLPPSVAPRATDHIDQMIAFGEKLQADGHTYPAPSGLYFDSTTVTGYGELAGLDIEGLREGARVEAVEGKRNPTDFAVWRSSPDDVKRQMEWDSPWGVGAPGWHLECSVMSMEYLGNQFDIHTGGVDHIPVHHTNEIAQSKAFLGTEDASDWVPTWMHNEFVLFGDEKMSKSAGRTLLVEDLIQQGYHPRVYRYLLLGSTYRQQLGFGDEAMDAARTALLRLLGRIPEGISTDLITHERAAEAIATEQGRGYLARMHDAISNDLNTPKVLAELHAVVRDDDLDDADRRVLLQAVESLLGLGLTSLTTDEVQRPAGDADDDLDTDAIDALVADRDRARADKDWGRADEIRDQLAELGVELLDGADGSTWRRRQ
ncbi:cysteine--tRNA ligase [Euzebya pacifica]|jgi:cysteinyl-tRNA synthetase|uniref:cysteine--tRNA ligase n=1 Tax=Euzebya pacifica TaxID=1608957 RepID=UPI0030FB1F56